MTGGHDRRIVRNQRWLLLVVAWLTAANMAASPALPQASAATGSFVSDDFATGLDTSRWSVVDPLEDASVAVIDSQLHIAVPDGQPHNPGVPNDAPRILQDLADGDLELTVRFESVPAEAFQIQGLVVEESPERFVRL